LNCNRKGTIEVCVQNCNTHVTPIINARGKIPEDTQNHITQYFDPSLEKEWHQNVSSHIFFNLHGMVYGIENVSLELYTN
jgi:hypothetical protein